MNRFQEHSKRKEAAHKTLLKNLQSFQEKIEALADSALIKDEAYRQLSDDNAELYREMKRMIDIVSTLPAVFQETIMNSEHIRKFLYPAPKNITENRQKKMNSEKHLFCNCGKWIHKYHMKEHTKRNCHSEDILKLDLEKKSNLRKYNLNGLLTLNSHLVALEHHREYFRYAPKNQSKYPPLYTLEMLLKRRRIRRLGQTSE